MKTTLAIGVKGITFESTRESDIIAWLVDKAAEVTTISGIDIIGISETTEVIGT